MINTIKGDVDFDPSIDYSEIKEIKGYLDCSGVDTKASFPKLTAIGGYLDCRGVDTKASFPKLKCGNKKAIAQIKAAFKKQGFVLFDDILSFIKTTKTKPNGVKIHRVVIVGKFKTSFCLDVNGVFSHGETIKEAKESLVYKISNRDKSLYKIWKLDKKITKRQAVESYMVITGSCEFGVRNFVEGLGKTKPKYTVKEIINLTKGQYGNQEYTSFFI